MPSFRQVKSNATAAQERYFRFPNGIWTQELAIFMCKAAQANLDCYGRFNVKENEDESVNATFTHEGADQLYETVRNWCKSAKTLELPIEEPIANCIGSKIVDTGINAFTFFMKVVDEDESKQNLMIVFGDEVSQFQQEFEGLCEKFTKEWSKSMATVKSANINITSYLASEVEKNECKEDTFICATLPSDDSDERKTSNVLIFGAEKANYLTAYKKLYDRYVFQDTPMVLTVILMKKAMPMERGEVLLIPNGRSTLIQPVSDDEDKNNAFYDEILNLRKACVEVKVETKLTDDSALMILCKECRMNNVFHSVSRGNVFLTGLKEDVKKFKQVLEKKIADAEMVVRRTRAH